MELAQLVSRIGKDIPGLLSHIHEEASSTPAAGSCPVTSAMPPKDGEDNAPQTAEAAMGGCGISGEKVRETASRDNESNPSRGLYLGNTAAESELSSKDGRCHGDLIQGHGRTDYEEVLRDSGPLSLLEGGGMRGTKKDASSKMPHASPSPMRGRDTVHDTARNIEVCSTGQGSRSSKVSAAYKSFTLMKNLKASLAAETANGRARGSENSTSRPSSRGHRTTTEGVLREASMSSAKKANHDTIEFDSTGDHTEASQLSRNSKNIRWHSSNFRMAWGQKAEDEIADFAARRFHIRESRNPDLGERLTQIYSRVGPPDGKAWSYQSNPAILVTGFTCLISLWTLWSAPFIASFWNAYYPLCEGLTRADLALDIVYAVCTLLTLRITYVDMDSRAEVIDPYVIKTMILRTPFFYYELFSSCVVVPVLAIGPTVRFLLLLKLLRAVNLWRLPRWTDRLRVKPIFRVCRLLAALFTIQHGVACALNYVIEMEDLWDEYVAQAKRGTDRYTLCYNYAINMLQAQISKGELLSRVEGTIVRHPGRKLNGKLKTCSEFKMTGSGGYCIVAPLGTIMVATLYGEINVLYQRLNILSDRHVESMAYITEAMRTLKLPYEMQGRVRQYFRFLHANRDKTAVSTLLDSLSEPLLQELKLNLYGDLIRKANFFKHCNPDFIRMILTKLHDCVYCPGDNIIQTGQEGDCMYFILKGTVDVLLEGSPILASKHEGDYFGELALLKPGTLRTATLRARTYTIVARLYARDFDAALEKYPDEMMNAFAGMNLLDPQELVTTLEQAKARIARAKEKKLV